jgi:chromate transporter
LTFLLLEVVPIHPAIVIALFLGYGAVHFRAAERLGARLDRSRRRKEGNA